MWDSAYMSPDSKDYSMEMGLITTLFKYSKIYLQQYVKTLNNKIMPFPAMILLLISSKNHATKENTSTRVNLMKNILL